MSANNDTRPTTEKVLTVPVVKKESRSVKDRLKRLVGSPHFRFSAVNNDLAPPIESTESNHPADERSGQPNQTPAAPLHQRASDSGPDSVLKPVPAFRRDRAHVTPASTHLPASAIEQFVGWTETSSAVWNGSAGELKEATAHLSPEDWLASTKRSSATAIAKASENEASGHQNESDSARTTSGVRSDHDAATGVPAARMNSGRSTTSVTPFLDSLTFGEKSFRVDAEHETAFSSTSSSAVTDNLKSDSGLQGLLERTQAIDALVRQAFSSTGASDASGQKFLLQKAEPAPPSVESSESSGHPNENDEAVAVSDERVDLRDKASSEASQPLALDEPALASRWGSPQNMSQMLGVPTEVEMSGAVDAKPLVDAATDQLENDRRWRNIVTLPERPWSEISNKMLGVGRAVLERLASGIDQLVTTGEAEVIVTGADRGVGTSTITISLARLLAERGERVLVVDADVHKAGLTHSLQLTENRSWITLVRGADILETGVVKTRDSQIAFATLSPLRLRTIWPPYVLDHLSNLLGTVHGVFDRILVDAGPVAQLTSEMSGNFSLAATGLVVAQVGSLDDSQTARIKNNLSGVGIQHVLFAQNFARKKNG